MFRRRLNAVRSAQTGDSVAWSGGGHRRALSVLGGCACCLALSAASLAEEPAYSDAARPTASHVDDLTPAALLDDLKSTARQKQERLERLRQQLLQLAEQSRPATLPSQTAPPPALDSQSVPPAPAGDPHAVPVPPEEHGLAPHDAPAPEQPSPRPDRHGKAHHGETASPGRTTDPPAPDERHAANSNAHPGDNSGDVAGARVNRLALGDSLFASGQTDLALQAYDSIEQRRLPAADRHWIQYQIANCHRRLGDTAEAEKRYRKLAGLIDGGWYAEHARWWLDAISTRTALERELAMIQRTVKTINEQLEEQPDESTSR